MFQFRATKSLFYRVHITPVPRTQSESNAILRSLQDIGPVSTFKIHHTTPGLDDKHDGDQQVHATLAFAYHTEDLIAFQDNIARHLIHVTANENITDASIRDPYNARGWKARTPEPLPRTFRCRVTHVEDLQEDGHLTSPNILEQLQNNEYAGPFTVDRRSVFGEILARTDAPSGLVQGLLPRIDDRYRDQPYKNNSPRNFEDGMREDGDDLAVNDSGDSETIMKSLDLTHTFSDDAIGGEEDTKPLSDASTDVGATTGEAFAELKDLSLMQMYRDAVSKAASKAAIKATSRDSSESLEAGASSTSEDSEPS